MKRILISAVCLILILTFAAGCGKSDDKRMLYNVDLSDYIKLGKYTGVTVDTESDKYKEYYREQIDNDISENELYKELSEGTVETGDIANIDYVGKKDGVAFEGGTADGYDLTIGSGQFIPGFEDGLIGVAVGSTVDLDLTFPEEYGNDELNGAAVVFTVTVNSVKRAMTPEDAYKKLGFKTLKGYEIDLQKRAGAEYILDVLTQEAEVLKYSQTDIDFLYESTREQAESYYSSYYGMSFDQVLAQSGMTEDDFKKNMLDNNIYPQSKAQMVVYYIFDKEKMTFTEEEIDAKINDMVNKNEGATVEKIEEIYGRHNFEYDVISEKVSEFLYKNAEIK